MRISKLSERAGLPVGTVKFYLRSGLLHPGFATSATQALYDETHLARLRLIRAMLGAGRLSLAEIQRILDAIDLPVGDPDVRVSLVQAAIAGPADTRFDDRTADADVLREMGWHIAPDSPHLPALRNALEAARSVGLDVDQDRLRVCAEAAAHVARSDQAELDSLPDAERPQALAASLVLLDPIFSALRRLAGEHMAAVNRGRVPGPRVSNA
ncbi:MerR family transcriptional regulator [Nocardioides sp. JQ2195]|uniref:MerR family transcriptional regulator n=1 Tax=Nocardioides sp. JQ2195 TaxID=2592334 RepID=UPI00143EED07|nr:MerR family transcriptional regulator [Nocardioides sp. JQ2195]QIX26144.1 MerR family transcriptional regulator [Nocardioides sp. JQ2195]